jgi:hypothetical protein
MYPTPTYNGDLDAYADKVKAEIVAPMYPLGIIDDVDKFFKANEAGSMTAQEVYDATMKDIAEKTAVQVQAPTAPNTAAAPNSTRPTVISAITKNRWTADSLIVSGTLTNTSTVAVSITGIDASGFNQNQKMVTRIVSVLKGLLGNYTGAKQHKSQLLPLSKKLRTKFRPT